MTNREIADKIGVSPATLSLVINNKPGISNSTREYVLDKLMEMNCLNIVKNSPIESEKNLCFIIFRRHGKIVDSSPFFMLLTQNIEEFARKKGYNIFITFLDKESSIDEQINHLNSMNCLGAMIFATEMLNDDLEYLSRLRYPVVLLDNAFPLVKYDSIAINNEMGTYQAIEYLFNKGHRIIGHLKSRTFIYSFGERELGYVNAMKCFGLEGEEKYTIEVGYSLEDSYHDFSIYLDENPCLPDAFFCDDDTIANGAIRALFEHGYKVPQDISIVGFNDRPICEQMDPKLDSICVLKDEFGAVAVDLLIKKIETHDRFDVKIRLGTKYISRDSVSSINV